MPKRHPEMVGDRCPKCNGVGLFDYEEHMVRADCDECHGTGLVNSPNACTRCGGSGKVISGEAPFLVEGPCPICNGNGIMPLDTPRVTKKEGPKGDGPIHYEKKD